MVEKGVDVMLATDVVTNAYNDHYDTAIVVSGDADFYPALQAAKDVGKHIEVAAFDMNLSAESARVADVVQKLNKTFFTGLWMTRAQARSRSAASSRPEVSDEAASPNGEDKAATKAATSRRSSTRKTATSAAGTKTRRTATTRARKPATRRSAAATASEKEDVAAESTTETKMRRTPTRRRVGGSSSSNGTSNGRSAPKPPALRKSSTAESKTESKAAEKTAPKPEPKKETADAEPVGSATRRRNWRGRLGLNNNEEE
jgi:hypothetical protein